MGNLSRWDRYPATYREKEVKLLAGWVANGASGAVVGLPGSGRSTLLTFLCRRPEVLQAHLQQQNQEAVLVPVDLNNMPDIGLATLYRVILRSFYEIRYRFEESTQNVVTSLYQKHEAARDPFLPQSGLRELLLAFEEEEKKVVLVMNRFDSFCQQATPEMTRTLRGLRDRFKETLCYIMGMDQEVTYFSGLAAVEPLYNILDTHVLWVGPLNRDDAADMIRRELKRNLDEDSTAKLLLLTGGYPSLIRVVCHWWFEISGKQGNSLNKLLEQSNVQNRLDAIFSALTQEEQVLLRDVTKRGSKLLTDPAENDRKVLDGLAKKGICHQSRQGWKLFSQLLEKYPKHAPGESLGRVWWNEETSEIYQGIKPIPDLAPLERKVLSLFLQSPRYLFSYTELAEGAWTEESIVAQGVSTEAIQQVISGLRKKIEPNKARPQYIISWRGNPEGGYQFFAEGRPN
jgi:DNA-binding response OmpR family regulator